MVFPDDPTCISWGINEQKAVDFGNKIGITSLPAHINFPVGTMFWAKSGALSKLYELGCDWNDYPQEPIGYDGTMLHAIERLLPLIAKEQGFSYKMTNIPGITR